MWKEMSIPSRESSAKNLEQPPQSIEGLVEEIELALPRVEALDRHFDDGNLLFLRQEQKSHDIRQTT